MKIFDTFVRFLLRPITHSIHCATPKEDNINVLMGDFYEAVDKVNEALANADDVMDNVESRCNVPIDDISTDNDDDAVPVEEITTDNDDDASILPDHEPTLEEKYEGVYSTCFVPTTQHPPVTKPLFL